MNKIIVICGPTGTGKTKLGIKLAKIYNGEIVSADSRQVYKYMDIGTGKDLSKISKFKFLISKKVPNPKLQIGFYEIEGVKIWLYDVCEPNYRFNVADYTACANLVIKDIQSRNKRPIIVGGTGFYIKGLIGEIGTIGIEPDWKLRKKLQSYTVTELQSLVQKENPGWWEKANESDRKNPRRLVRALEIKGKYVKRNTQNVNIKNCLMICLTAPKKVLCQKIDKRVEERVKQGLEREIKGLLEKGYGWDNSALGTTIGYKEWQRGNKEEIIQRWKFSEHDYARRQITWFRAQKNLHFIDITGKKWEDKVKYLIHESKN